MIKIPATNAGLAAITEVDRRGHQRQRHADLQPRALPRGHRRLPRRASSRPRPPASTSRRSTRSPRSSCRASTPRSTSASTAIGTDEALALKSKAGVANARLAYELFEKEFATDRAKALLDAGANVQRPLWASTGVKDPALPDTLYVTELVAPGTVNTMPEKTLEATFDHGVDRGRHRHRRLRRRRTRCSTRSPRSASTTTTSPQLLEDEGVEKFIVSWNELLDTVTRRRCEAARVSFDDPRHRRGRQGRRRRDRPRPGRRPRRVAASPRSDADAVGPGGRGRGVEAPRLGRGRRRLARRSSPRSRRSARELAAEGVTHIVLAGMGGSSLAPEVIAQHLRRRRSRARLDRPRPGARRARATGSRAPRSSSRRSRARRSRPTASKRAFEAAFRDVGIDPLERIVVVTDPGSPLDVAARADGYRVFNADPNVGGRYSALTAFGLVPTGLAGVDIAELLDEAEAIAARARDRQPRQPRPRARRRDRRRRRRCRDKLGIVTDGTHIVGFADWVEQLVAESTGKEGTGILPVVLDADSPELDGRACPTCRSCGSSTTRDEFHPRAPRGRDRSSADRSARSSSSGSTRRPSPAGCSASTRSTSPTSSRRRSPRAACSTPAPSPTPPPSSMDGVEVRGTDPTLAASGNRRRRARRAARRSVPADGYIVDPGIRRPRSRIPQLAELRELARRRLRAPGDVRLGTAVPALDRPVPQGRTRGRRVPADPRATGDDLEIPDRPFTFGQLIQAQAAGDASVLAEHGRPVLTLTLTDPSANVAALFDAVG